MEKTTKCQNNLLIGCVILCIALFASSARAGGGERKFLPLNGATATTGRISAETGRQFIPLRSVKRDGTTHKMMALNGGVEGRNWKLSELRETPRMPKAKEVPVDVKLAMAKGYMPRAGEDAPLPRAGEKQEMIAAALAPVIEEMQKRQQPAEEDFNTDIEDAHDALVASLPGDVKEAVHSAMGYVWPVSGEHYRISSPFGYRTHPITGKRAFHAGIDIPAPRGTDVLAAIDGEVTGVGEHPRLGRYVKVSHADGTYSLYGHLQKWSTKMGRMVKAGDIIGKVGSTGRSTGPHLDFSIRRDGKPFNPMSVLSSLLDEKKLALNK